MGENRWFVDEDGRLVWPLDTDPRAIYLDAAQFAVHQAAPERQARDAFEALRSVMERQEALEEIRQRVADGWTAGAEMHIPDAGFRDETPRWHRYNGVPDEVGAMSPEVAALLWPTTEEEPGA